MSRRDPKPTAASRALDMFAPPPPEVLPEYPKEDRVPIPEDADRMRDQAFQTQEWTTAAFGLPDATGNQYRLTLRKDHYYLEAVSGSRYCGLMIHERDLFNMTGVFVDAARAKKARQ